MQQEDWDFYLEIWNEREHRCFETGRWLGNEPSTAFFHHLLEKRDYPEFRHCKWNIVIIHPMVHDQINIFGLGKTPRVKELTEKVKQEYL